MSKLDGIIARADAFETHGTPGRHAPEDRKDLLAALRAVEALHVPAGYTESVIDWDCIEGECEHDDDCPEKTITPCRQCTLPSLDGAEILIPWPCPTIGAIREALA